MPVQTKLVQKDKDSKIDTLDLFVNDKGADLLVARMDRYADSPCYRVTDIRLTQHRQMTSDNFSFATASSYRCEYLPVDDYEANYVISRLKSYQVLASGAIAWASFDGVVKGHESVNGYKPPRSDDFDQTGYFSETEALAIMNAINGYWQSLDEIPGAGDWRIDNPNRQPNEDTVAMMCRFRKDFLDEKVDQAIFDAMEDFSGMMIYIPYVTEDDSDPRFN